jgi:hypothetical protein
VRQSGSVAWRHLVLPSRQRRVDATARKISARQIRVHQGGNLEVRPAEVRVVKGRPAEVCRDEVRLAEVRPPEIRPAEIQPAEVRPLRCGEDVGPSARHAFHETIPFTSRAMWLSMTVLYRIVRQSGPVDGVRDG